MSDFKSDPKRTTQDNINAFLEKKNNNVHSFDSKPKFATINSGQTRVLDVGNVTNINTIAGNYTSPPTNMININAIPNIGAIKSEEEIKNGESSDADSDLDIFVLFP